MELHLRDPGDNPTSTELLLERSIAKESEPFSTEMEQSRTEETHATQFEIPTNPVYYSKEVIPVGERKRNDIPTFKCFKGDSLKAEISKLVMRLVRHYDQDERETDADVHWNSMVPKLQEVFQKSGRRFRRRAERREPDLACQPPKPRLQRMLIRRCIPVSQVRH